MQASKKNGCDSTTSKEVFGHAHTCRHTMVVILTALTADRGFEQQWRETVESPCILCQFGGMMLSSMFDTVRLLKSQAILCILSNFLAALGYWNKTSLTGAGGISMQIVNLEMNVLAQRRVLVRVFIPTTFQNSRLTNPDQRYMQWPCSEP
jgi:hypothetical protein